MAAVEASVFQQDTACESSLWTPRIAPACRFKYVLCNGQRDSSADGERRWQEFGVVLVLEGESIAILKIYDKLAEEIPSFSLTSVVAHVRRQGVQVVLPHA